MNTSNPPVPSDSRTLPPVPRRRWWLTLICASSIFSSGLVVGGGATLIVVRNRALRAIHHPDEAPPRIAARLRSALRLSPEQTEQVETIVRRRQQALQAIRREVQPQVVAELDRVESEIAAVLDAGQQAKWHALFTHLRETWLPPPPVGEESS